MRKLLSFVFSVALVFALMGLLWLIDIVRQNPEIPSPVIQESLVEVVRQPKKHNHVDDFCLNCPPLVVKEMQARG
ncbi:MAG TPA: hypothetical protein VLL54_00400 [Pyrinomonadaceae bacterium]|nr:hypothetical protein [Pyrinomonadaceae bacterium]